MYLDHHTNLFVKIQLLVKRILDYQKKEKQWIEGDGENCLVTKRRRKDLHERSF